MAGKTFTTYAPTEEVYFEINGTRFNCVPVVPGDVLLDFLSNADEEHPNLMAGALRNLIDAAIKPEELEKFHSFIRDPKNFVSMDVLAEIAGYLADKLSGAGDPTRQPAAQSSAG
jgi:hypothetical protein